MPFDAAATVQVNAACLLCPVEGCLARRSGGDQAEAWADILAPCMAVMPGAANLFSAGDRMDSVCTVRGGCLKTYTLDGEGNEHIRGFFLPGDVIGLDGLGGGVHRSSAAAVTPAQVCVAPLAELRRLMQRQPQLGQRMLEQTSRDLAQALALSGNFGAEQRLAAFLLQLRDRLGGGSVLRLPMGQRDMGNYLRLATETVCRTLKGFERRGWLAVEGPRIRLLGEHHLRQLAEPVGMVASAPSLAQAA